MGNNNDDDEVDDGNVISTGGKIIMTEKVHSPFSNIATAGLSTPSHARSGSGDVGTPPTGTSTPSPSNRGYGGHLSRNNSFKRSVPPRTPSSGSNNPGSRFGGGGRPLSREGSFRRSGPPQTKSSGTGAAAGSGALTPGRMYPPSRENSFRKSPLSRSNSSSSFSSNRSKSPTPESLQNNPIKTDATLKSMVEELADIHSHRNFKMWKSSFLNRYEEFLGQEDRTAAAQAAYDEFRTSMNQFVKYVTQVEKYVQDGALTVERTTVKGRNSLNEMNKWLVKVIEKERLLVPSRRHEEKKRGYTKFHLGAVLVKDGFSEYQQMDTCCNILKRLQEHHLQGVADKQQLEEIDNYDRQMKRFRDLMADLGLYDVMVKSWELGQPEDEFIFVDLKTGTIGTVGVLSCIEAGIVHTIDKDGNETTPGSSGSNPAVGYREAIKDEEDKHAIISMVKESLHL